MFKKYFAFLMFTSFVPVFANAETLGSTLGTVSNLINMTIPIILALAILYFFWKVATYIFNSDDDQKRSAAIKGMVTGLIAIFVMVSVWGIIALLQQTFKVGGAAPIIPPRIQSAY